MVPGLCPLDPTKGPKAAPWMLICPHEIPKIPELPGALPPGPQPQTFQESYLPLWRYVQAGRRKKGGETLVIYSNAFMSSKT